MEGSLKTPSKMKLDLSGDTFIIGQVENQKVRPLLKWAGGKRWLVPHLEPLWQKHRESRLVEPLSGGIAITFGLRPKKALLNDVNPHLINFYQQVKSGLKVKCDMQNNKDYYYRSRDRFNSLIEEGKWKTKEAAELFYYLNHTGYNGLCRFNSSGLFNVPFGRYKTINYIKDFSDYKKILINWEFSTGDFSEVKIRKGDFVYVDPPYDVEFRQYSADGFTWKDQERVARWASDLQVPVVITNQATKRILNLYEDLGFKLDIVEVPRFINCVGNKRGPVKEIIGTKDV